MTLRRPIWLAFAIALIAVLAAMGWITAVVVRLDGAEADSRRRAQLEENARLALWRMDSALAPLIAAEHARPHAAFRERRPVGKATKGKPTTEENYLSDWFDGSPPPLPGESTPFAKLYFHLEASGRLTSPHAKASTETRAPVTSSSSELDAFAAISSAEQLFAVLPPVAIRPGVNMAVAANDGAQVAPNVQSQGQQTGAIGNASTVQEGQQPVQQDQQQLKQQAEAPNGPLLEPQQYAQARRQRDEVQQAQRNRQEYNARAANNSIQYQVQNGAYGNFDPGGFGPPAPANDSTPSVMHAVWCGVSNDQLVLARRVASGTGSGDSVEGCWVDWPGVQAWLLKGSADLLPDAKLEPVAEPEAELGDARLLASLPVRLVPGKLPPAASDGSSPLRISLVVAWACVLLASAAVAGLLRGVVSLSERRGAFVSAVTHELRTPLTTLRMYTEMLEGGMVEDESQRRHYLGTLRAEADRLGHLVENVLAYSRLERRRDTSSEVIESPLGDLLRRPVERLAERARQGGMTLHVDLPENVANTRVHANPTSLEQILFNLVDNACKYAAGSNNTTINLSAARTDGKVRLTVRDHGPGIPNGREARMFKPFSKSVQEAANSAPGLGLGLALSKRLARAMDGHLDLDAGCHDGACFVLTLPVT